MLFAFALAIAWIETVMDDIVKLCKSFCKCASIVKGHWISFQDLTLQVWFESLDEFVQDLVPAFAIQLLHALLESIDITGHPTGLMQSVQFVVCSSDLGSPVRSTCTRTTLTLCTMLFAFALAIAWIETVMDDIVKPCKSFCKCASIVKGHWICFQDLTLQVWFESSYEFV